MLLSWVTGSVSSVNLSAFDVIGSKAREIAGDDIVTIGNGESGPWQHRNLKSKTFVSKSRSCLTQLIIVVNLPRRKTKEILITFFTEAQPEF